MLNVDGVLRVEESERGRGFRSHGALRGRACLGFNGVTQQLKVFMPLPSGTARHFVRLKVTH